MNKELIEKCNVLARRVETPSSHWSADGKPDPHGKTYDCERAGLHMGNLTDDELANGAFLNYDQPLNVAGILAGTCHSPIAWMTAVKDRIRWLSRSLEKVAAERAALAAELKALRDQKPVAVYKGHRHIPSDTKEFWGMADNHLPAGTHLYAPPVLSRELTDKVIERLFDESAFQENEMRDAADYFAHEIERYLKGEGE